MICTLPYGFVSAKLYTRIKDCSKSRIIVLSWLSKIRCCSTHQHPFKPDNKAYQPHGNGGKSDVGPLSIALPRYKRSNGDIIYTNDEHASVTTILKNSMPYSDQIRILKWKEKTRTQLGHLEYHKASKMANGRSGEESTNNTDDDDLNEHGDDKWANYVEKNHISTISRLQSDEESTNNTDDDDDLNEHGDDKWANHVEKNHISTISRLQSDEESTNNTDDDDDLNEHDDDLNEHGDDKWANHVEKNHISITSRLQSLEDELVRHELPENITNEELKLYEATGNIELRKYVKLIRKRGHSLHELIRDYLSNQQLKDFFKTTTYWKSVSHVLDEITHVYALESCVHHSDLEYAGTVDAIAEFRGNTCVLDWKTSKKIKRTFFDCYDYPYQAVAYAGAINQDSNYPFQIDSVAVVIVYNDGQPASVIQIAAEDCRLIWEQWLIRLQMYKINCNLREMTHDRINFFSDDYWHRKALLDNKIQIKILNLSDDGKDVEPASSLERSLNEMRMLHGRFNEYQTKIKERFRVSKRRQ